MCSSVARAEALGIAFFFSFLFFFKQAGGAHSARVFPFSKQLDAFQRHLRRPIHWGAEIMRQIKDMAHHSPGGATGGVAVNEATGRA